jgi:diguanylate cyclase (GGDEF)-like protein/PAS domain S-box-containing protein
VATTPIDPGERPSRRPPEARVHVPRTTWLAVALAAGVIAVAATLAPLLAVIITCAVVATASLAVAGVLWRLALAIHHVHRSMGPCRGAGFVGLGGVFSGLGAAGAAVTWVHLGAPAAARVLVVATVLAAPSLLMGILLLPGAAPTLGARLRRLLDGLSIGITLLYTAWLLVSPGGGPEALIVVTTCCLTLAANVVTGLRAAHYRRAALSCSAGAAMATVGLATMALTLPSGRVPPGLTLGAIAVLVGPILMLYGASRVDDGPAEVSAVDDEGTFSGYPILAGPVIIGLGASAFHFLTGGHFNATTVILGIAGVGAVAIREGFTAWDIRRYANRLAGQRAHFRALVAGSSDVTVVLDANLVVRWQSPASARQFGLSDQDVLQQPFTALLHPDDVEPAHDALAAVLAGRQVGLLRARLRDGFGRWRETESTVTDQRGAPEVAGVVVHVRDVGDRAELERTLDEMTWTDDLTGLANRRKLLAGVAEAQRADGPGGALLVVELDRFASINDLHGPAVGDAVLVEVARRIRAGSDPADTPARLAADAFGVLTAAPLVHAFALATRLATMLAEPYHLPGHTVHLAADIGVSDLSGGETAEDVLRHADVARRRAHQLGRGRVEC